MAAIDKGFLLWLTNLRLRCGAKSKKIGFRSTAAKFQAGKDGDVLPLNCATDHFFLYRDLKCP
jgi:hypothetical protein